MGHTHTLLTPTIIGREALRLLKNSLVMGNQVYRAYEKEFPGSPKKGGTVTIRKPVKFSVTKSRVRVTSTISEYSITMTVATQAHVSWQFSAVDLTLKIEEYSERYIKPAAAVLANTVDADLCALYDDVWNTVYESTGFVDPSTFMVLGKAMQKLDEEACPPTDRCVVFNPAAHWSMANALHNLNAQNVGEQALRKGFLGRIANADIYMDQNIKAHTAGHAYTTGATASRLIMASTQLPTSGFMGTTSGVGDYILIQGIDQTTGATALKVGDVLTINGVYAVNPMSGESTGALRCFVVTENAVCSTESTGHDTSVGIDPQIRIEPPYQTVNAFPVSAAVVNVFFAPSKTYPQNLAFHKNAFALCMVPLEKSEDAWGATITEDGYSIRVVKQYGIDADVETIRLDILYGVKTIYPELAVRIVGAEA